MKISSIAAIFVFGSSVTANPGSIRSERNDIEFDRASGFTHDNNGEDWWGGEKDDQDKKSWMDRFKNPVSVECNSLHRVNGCLCAKDEQCNSGRCSIKFECDSKLEAGETCGEDDDCASAMCERGDEFHWRNILKKCGEKLDDGEECKVKDNCKGGICEESVCKSQALSDNGDACLRDDDCTSGLCVNLFCAAEKLASGEYCLTSDDCQSGECAWSGIQRICQDEVPTNPVIPTESPANKPVEGEKKPIGAGCMSNDACESGKCIDLQCAEELKPGGAYCMSDDDCQSGACSYLRCEVPKTAAPTVSPTAAPITPSPTAAPITQSPTSASPVTASPSAAPVAAETPTPPTEAPKKANGESCILSYECDSGNCVRAGWNPTGECQPQGANGDNVDVPAMTS